MSPQWIWSTRMMRHRRSPCTEVHRFVSLCTKSINRERKSFNSKRIKRQKKWMRCWSKKSFWTRTISLHSTCANDSSESTAKSSAIWPMRSASGRKLIRFPSSHAARFWLRWDTCLWGCRRSQLTTSCSRTCGRCWMAKNKAVSVLTTCFTCCFWWGELSCQPERKLSRPSKTRTHPFSLFSNWP